MLLFGRNISMSCIYACPLASSKFNLRKCGLSRGEQPYNFSKKPFNLVSTFNLNFNQNTNINNPNIRKVDTLAGGSILGVLDYSKSFQLTLRDANICWVHGYFCSNFSQLLLLLCMLEVFSDWPSFLIIRGMRKCTIVHIPTVQRQLDLKYSFEKTLSDELIVSLNALNPVSLTVFQQKRRRIETKEYYI